MLRLVELGQQRSSTRAIEDCRNISEFVFGAQRRS
jgi:hypothetical protein